MTRKKLEPVDPDALEPEQPPLSDALVDGALDLRAHFEQRKVSLQWALQKLPSMAQHQSDFESATEAVEKLAVRHALSTSKLDELREWLLRDAYAFSFLVCRHRDIIPDVHMAMCYASAGQAQKLAWLITQSGLIRSVTRNAISASYASPMCCTGATTDGLSRRDGWP